LYIDFIANLFDLEDSRVDLCSGLSLETNFIHVAVTAGPVMGDGVQELVVEDVLVFLVDHGDHLRGVQDVPLQRD